MLEIINVEEKMTSYGLHIRNYVAASNRIRYIGTPQMICRRVKRKVFILKIEAQDTLINPSLTKHEMT